MNIGLPPVLVVDDDTAILDVLGGQIAIAGYRADVFSDPREALDALRGTSYAAIISDYRMPQMCGLDLLARAREVQPGATRILITGVLSIESLLGSIESGLLHRFLAKPWARVELLAAIESAVQHHRLLGENQRLRAEADRLSGALNGANAKVEILLEQLTRRGQGAEKIPTTVREVDAADLRPGMKVARAVSVPAGRLMLEPGDELTADVIGQLQDPRLPTTQGRRVLVYERLTVCG